MESLHPSSFGREGKERGVKCLSSIQKNLTKLEWNMTKMIFENKEVVDRKKTNLVENTIQDLNILSESNSNDRKLPTFEKVTIPGNINIIKVVTSSLHTLCLSSEGECFIFGNNQDLKDPKSKITRIPTQDMYHLPANFTEEIGFVKEIACSYSMTVIALNTGKVFSCGDSKRGLLGRDGPGDKFLEVNVDEPIELISCGRKHCCMISDSGSVIVFGSNKYGIFFFFLVFHF